MNQETKVRIMTPKKKLVIEYEEDLDKLRFEKEYDDYIAVLSERNVED